MIDEKRNSTNTSQEKKMKKSEQTKLAANQKRRWVQIRLIPIWLRIVLVLILLFFAAITGVIIGYSGIGDGEPLGALEWEAWQHILDLINGEVQ